MPYKNKNYDKKYRLDKYIQDKKLVLSHYGNKCICCGEKNIWFLSLDHVNNDGYKFGKSRNGMKYYQLLKNGFPTDIQILCFNCNQGKNNPVNKFICPHNFN